MNYTTIKNFSFFFLFFVLVFPSSVQAVGQMTEPVMIQEALRGEEMEVTLILLNSSEKSGIYELDADGDIETWVSFFSPDDPGEFFTEIEIPAQTYLEVMALISLPKDIPNGDYQGSIHVGDKASQEEDGETSVAISHGVGREVFINVGDEENVDFLVSVIPEKYNLEEEEALPVRVIYNNRGNVSISPQIGIEVFQEGELLHKTVFPYPSSLNPVRPLSQKEIPAVYVPVYNLESGKYLAHLNFKVNDQDHLSKEFFFSVGQEESGLWAWGSWVDRFPDVGKYTYILLVAFAGFCVFALGLYLRYYRKERVE